MSRHFAIDDAELYRDLAMQRRNRGAGGSTVRVYASTRALDAARGETEHSPHRQFCEELRARFYCDLGGIHQAFLDAVYPERRIPVDLIDTF